MFKLMGSYSHAHIDMYYAGASIKNIKIQALLEAYIKGEPIPQTYDGCCVWVDEGNNLWFRDDKYQKPSLLAVKTMDGVVNLRNSGSDASRHGKDHYWVIRKHLKDELASLSRAFGLKVDFISKLTAQKADQRMLVRFVTGV